jgi:hypothetical protein
VDESFTFRFLFKVFEESNKESNIDRPNKMQKRPVSLRARLQRVLKNPFRLRARLQPCRRCFVRNAALAAEVRFLFREALFSVLSLKPGNLFRVSAWRASRGGTM